jgi:hypothetical protein
MSQIDHNQVSILYNEIVKTLFEQSRHRHNRKSDTGDFAMIQSQSQQIHSLIGDFMVREFIDRRPPES